jgi:hypothetical protein
MLVIFLQSARELANFQFSSAIFFYKEIRRLLEGGVTMGDIKANPPSSTPSTIHLTDRDRQVLALTDEEYTLLSWDYVKEAIGTLAEILKSYFYSNFMTATQELDKLTRLPSQLRLYQQWSGEISKQYGSSTNFLIQERLYWKQIASGNPDEPLRFNYKSPVPFAERKDYRILINDWPYGLEKNIKHICVWLKNRLPADKTTGRITKEGFDLIQNFVQETFHKGLGVEGQDKVLWFRNYTILQSIRAIDHVHVLVQDVDDATLDAILEKPPFEEETI